MITIKAVRSRAQRKAFASYPMKLYKDCEYFVPVFYADDYNILSPKKNLCLEECDADAWLAYQGKKLVGRICGIIQKQFNRMWDKHVMRFSRFDCINDVEVAEALFAAASAWGKARGMDTITGPWDFNDQGREGMLTHGFDRRGTYVAGYYYPYMKDLVEQCGFEPDSEWVEYSFKIPTEPNPKFQKVADMVAKRLNLTEIADSEPFSKLVKHYGHEFFDLINKEYAKLDGYVPISGKVLDNVLYTFTMIMNPRYLSMITNEKGELIAVAACITDISGVLRRSKGHMTLPAVFGILKRVKHAKALEMVIIGVRSDYQNRGVNAMMLNRILNNMIEDKVEYIESNPELTTNIEVQSQWNSIEREEIKRRRTFHKAID